MDFYCASGYERSRAAIRQSLTHWKLTHRVAFPGMRLASCCSFTTTKSNADRSEEDACFSSGTASTRAAPMARMMRGTIRADSLAFSLSELFCKKVLSEQRISSKDDPPTLRTALEATGTHSGATQRTDFPANILGATGLDMISVRYSMLLPQLRSSS